MVKIEAMLPPLPLKKLITSTLSSCPLASGSASFGVINLSIQVVASASGVLIHSHSFKKICFSSLLEIK